MRAWHGTKQWRHKGKMYSELDPKPAYIKTLCFCPTMTTNRQLPSSQRSVWAHQKHSWACNLFKNGFSVSSLELRDSSSLRVGAAKQCCQQGLTSTPSSTSFPWPSISTAQSSTWSESLGKEKTKFFHHWSSLHQHKGEGRITCVLSTQGRASLRWFALNFSQNPLCLFQHGLKPLDNKSLHNLFQVLEQELASLLPGSSSGSCQVRQKEL